MSISLIILIVCIFIWCCNVWFKVCNNKAYEVRTGWLDKIAVIASQHINAGGEDWKEFYNDFEKISYNRTLFELAFFQKLTVPKCLQTK